MIRKGDGNRERGVSVVNRTCYTLEDFQGKKDSLCNLAATRFDGVLGCALVLPKGVRNNAYVLETWFGLCVLPSMRKGETAVLDNAALHRKKPLKAMAKAAGINLLFLPKYSPELSWIEFCFGWLKHAVKDLDRNIEHLEIVALAALMCIPPAVVAAYCKNCGWLI